MILSVVLFGLVYNPNEMCSLNLVDHGRGYLGILLSCMIAELAIIWLSMRGSILYTEPRDSMQYVLYVRLGKRPEPPCVCALPWSLPSLPSLPRWLLGCAVHPDESIGCALPRLSDWQAVSQTASFSSHGICSPSVSLFPPMFSKDRGVNLKGSDPEVLPVDSHDPSLQALGGK